MKLSKVITIILIFIIVMCFCVNSYAFSPIKFKPSSTMTVTGQSELVEEANSIIGIIITAGIVVSVVMLIVLGIKYMLGSADEKATYKKSMIPYLIGALLIFSASTIANIIYNYAKWL